MWESVRCTFNTCLFSHPPTPPHSLVRRFVHLFRVAKPSPHRPLFLFFIFFKPSCFSSHPFSFPLSHHLHARFYQHARYGAWLFFWSWKRLSRKQKNKKRVGFLKVFKLQLCGLVRKLSVEIVRGKRTGNGTLSFRKLKSVSPLPCTFKSRITSFLLSFLSSCWLLALFNRIEVHEEQIHKPFFSFFSLPLSMPAVASAISSTYSSIRHSP